MGGHPIHGGSQPLMGLICLRSRYFTLLLFFLVSIFKKRGIWSVNLLTRSPEQHQEIRNKRNTICIVQVELGGKTYDF